MFKEIFDPANDNLTSIIMPETVAVLDDRFCRNATDLPSPTNKCREPLNYEGVDHYIHFRGQHYLAASWFVFDYTLFFPIGLDFDNINISLF